MNWNKLLLSPHGRIGRKSYWLFLGASMGIGLVIMLIELALLRTDDGPISRFYNLGTTWFWICVGTKRLHDLGLSGWWQVAGYGALIAGVGAAAFAWGETGMYLVFAVMVFAAFGWLGASKGRDGPNKYGEPNSGDREVTPPVEVFS